MKKAIHKIFAILMTFVVLLSTMSFTVSMHYCQGTLVDSSLFQKAHSCGMDQNMKMEVSTTKAEKSMKSCCSDEEIEIDGQDDLKRPVLDLTFNQQIFITSLVHYYIDLFTITEESKTSFVDYPHPFIVRQLFKLDETYLI